MAHFRLAAALTLGLAALTPFGAQADEAPPAAAPQLTVSLTGPGFWTGDLDAALRFWTEGLGMVELTRLGFGDTVEVILGFSGNPNPPMVMLLARSDGDGEATAVNDRDKLVLAVSSADAARARLVSAGYEPTELHVHEASGTRVFFVKDPDGHRLEVTQPPPRPAQQ